MKKNKRILFNEKRDRGLTGFFLYKLYGLHNKKIRKLVEKFLWYFLGKHFQFYSRTIRKILKKYHNVEVGHYSHGGCCVPGSMPPGTKVGKYCSIAVTVTVFTANHPTNIRSSHAFFFNPGLGHIIEDKIPYTHLTIGNDVWIGHNAVILPSCSSIGDGAVIGAGAIINKNIPPYAIVLGNPARVVRFRFSPEIIKQLLEEKWWDKEIDEIKKNIDDFIIPLEDEKVR